MDTQTDVLHDESQPLPSRALTLGQQLGRMDESIKEGARQRSEMMQDIKTIKNDLAQMRTDFAGHLVSDEKMAAEIASMKSTLDELAPAIRSAFEQRKQASFFVSGAKWAFGVVAALLIAIVAKLDVILSWVKSH
jgi:chromosome segregation ATPase